MRTTARLRANLLARIRRFGSGRMEVHSAILEALIRDLDDASANAPRDARGSRQAGHSLYEHLL
jgi:hypothetical protein